jgi:hypothetical protein
MAYGMSSALAVKILNHLRNNTTWTPPTTIYAKLHVGDPGANGTANPSAVTTRVAVTFALSGNTIIITGTPPSWTMTTTETIQGVSFWDASTAGTFLWSSQLAVARPVIAADTPSLVAESFGFGSGIAA